jgi:hypothetical protein
MNAEDGPVPARVLDDNWKATMQPEHMVNQATGDVCLYWEFLTPGGPIHARAFHVGDSAYVGIARNKGVVQENDIIDSMMRPLFALKWPLPAQPTLGELILHHWRDEIRVLPPSTMPEKESL